MSLDESHTPVRVAAPRLLVIGIADHGVSDEQDHVLVTYALGSCIAVAVYDPARRAAGMLHYMLPTGSIVPDQGASEASKFADTGIPLLFRTMYQFGCKKTDLVVRITGGSKLYDDNGVFDIGRRNHAAARQILWKAGVRIAAEDVGGNISRTMRLVVATGGVTVRSGAEEKTL
ncbi:MAG: chemotaxis protein CheD [Deltaproteobacteria bacterium]